MIIGNGLIANSLKGIDSENYVFFASGVSNSLETRNTEFEREFILLKKTLESNSEGKLIYFSTLSIKDQSKQNTQYVLHKLTMEEYIKTNSKNYMILRIGNVVGKGGNPNTLFNFLKTQIISSRSFALHTQARRLLLDIDDIYHFMEANCLEGGNKVINLAFPYYYDLKEIIGAIEKETHQKAYYSEVNEGDFYRVDFDKEIHDFFSGISPESYLETLTRKYI
ncbi:NAD(P)-dependent oxidoreductase [Chryseobacterium indologenes]|uniref:NAD(P)-dependent oxidoreductase n=1 Tax=Chryseobacterium indologenes TaxID=253 RepID=A0A411DR67_CHRID|nr:NAD(P)-dependent oxidoreductase [Chryseobacterium indologenes]